MNHSSIDKVDILDTSGRVVYSSNDVNEISSARRLTINMAGLEPGQYMLSVYLSNGRVNQLIVTADS